MHEDLLSLFPKTELSDLNRRRFIVTTLAAGFALATHPVAAQTMITTDTAGLVAGEVKELPGRARRAGDFRRARAHQGHLPTLRQARLHGDCAGDVRAAGRRVE